MSHHIKIQHQIHYYITISLKNYTIIHNIMYVIDYNVKNYFDGELFSLEISLKFISILSRFGTYCLE